MSLGKLIVFSVLSALCADASGAASAFEPVPAAAVKSLKVTRSKTPSRDGFVFACGHYLKPPYKVVRKGTAVFVNGEQVTGQIVPWRSFLATQEAMNPAPAQAPVAPKPTKTEAEKNEDDLFGEGAADAEAAAKAKAAEKQAEMESEAAAAFTPNERSKALLKRVNAVRLDADKRLRNGGVLFYGKDYARITVDARTAAALLAALPDAMRDANDAEDLHRRMRGKFPFMSRELCADLIAHRADCVALAERAGAMRESAKIQSMVDSAAGR